MTQTVPDISPLMLMHQDPLLVSYFICLQVRRKLPTSLASSKLIGLLNQQTAVKHNHFSQWKMIHPYVRGSLSKSNFFNEKNIWKCQQNVRHIVRGQCDIAGVALFWESVVTYCIVWGDEIGWTEHMCCGSAWFIGHQDSGSRCLSNSNHVLPWLLSEPSWLQRVG